MKIRQYILTLAFLSLAIICSGQCPPASGLYTDNYNFNSSSTSVEGNWNSMANTEVDHFMLKYKKLEDQDWNNLIASDSACYGATCGYLSLNHYILYIYSLVYGCNYL